MSVYHEKVTVYTTCHCFNSRVDSVKTQYGLEIQKTQSMSIFISELTP